MNKTIRFIPAIMMAAVAIITFNTNLTAALIAVAAAAITLIPNEGKK